MPQFLKSCAPSNAPINDNVELVRAAFDGAAYGPVARAAASVATALAFDLSASIILRSAMERFGVNRALHA